MYTQKYEFVEKRFLRIINLKRFNNEIEDAILQQFPNAKDIKVEKTYYSFATLSKPSRGQLSAIGRQISYKTPLKGIVKQYPLKYRASADKTSIPLCGKKL